MAVRQDFEKELRKDKRLPVYVLTSTDAFMLSEAIQKLRNLCLTAAPDFNRNDFRAGSCKPAEVLAAASSMPMMAPLRWVHLCDIHRLKAKDQAPYLTYLKNPSPTTVLCLSGAKLDSRTKFGKALSKAKVVFALTPPKPNQMVGWLRTRARVHGYDLENDAADLLADMVAGELGVLDNTLHQVACYAGTQTPITLEHVEACVASTRVRSIFELTDAIGQRNLARASSLVRNALDGGDDGLRVLAMVSRQLRQLLQIRQYMDLGNPPQEITRALKLSPYIANTLIEQAKRYTLSELCHAMTCAAEADVRLKSSRLSHGVILDRLLVDMRRHGASTP